MCISSLKCIWSFLIMRFYYILYKLNNYANYGNSWLCELSHLTFLISLFWREKTQTICQRFMSMVYYLYEHCTAYIL